MRISQSRFISWIGLIGLLSARCLAAATDVDKAWDVPIPAKNFCGLKNAYSSIQRDLLFGRSGYLNADAPQNEWLKANHLLWVNSCAGDINQCYARLPRVIDRIRQVNDGTVAIGLSIIPFRYYPDSLDTIPHGPGDTTNTRIAVYSGITIGERRSIPQTSSFFIDPKLLILGKGISIAKIQIKIQGGTYDLATGSARKVSLTKAKSESLQIISTLSNGALVSSKITLEVK